MYCFLRSPFIKRKVIIVKFAKAENDIITQYLIPEKIVLQENTVNADILLNEHSRQAFLGELPACRLGKGGYIVFDFGCEFQGGADIVVQQTEHETEKLRIVFGESISEALGEVGEKNATNNHSPRDFIVETGFLSHLSIGNTGYRFLKLESIDGEISISSVQGISRYRDLKYIGSFKCNDKLLNEIWCIGAKTVHLNMQEYLWDGIKRDRLVWVGDMHPETSTISMVFGETDVVKKSLDFVRDNTPASTFMNGFASYSMWWIKIQRDLYWDFGNLAYLRDQEKYLIDLLENILDHIDKNGFCDIDEKFVEWSSKNTPDEETAFYAMLIVGLNAGIELLEVLNTSAALVCRCKNASECIKSNTYIFFKNKQAAAMGGLSGLSDLKQLCENVIKPGGAEGLSAFWGYYVLLALAKAGETEFALDIMRSYWGGMIALGATTFWEDFDIKWLENTFRIDELPRTGKNDVHGDFGKFCYKQFRHSLCHGWSCGPTAFLSRNILGIEIVEPGYKRIRVKPDLGGLSYAEGSIPTPLGVIYVRHDLKNGKTKTEIDVPKGITIE